MVGIRTRIFGSSKKAGVNVSYPNKSLFSEKSKSVIDQYKKDPFLKEIIEEIKSK